MKPQQNSNQFTMESNCCKDIFSGIPGRVKHNTAIIIAIDKESKEKKTYWYESMENLFIFSFYLYLQEKAQGIVEGKSVKTQLYIS